jgi:hypothetical protein
MIFKKFKKKRIKYINKKVKYNNMLSNSITRLQSCIRGNLVRRNNYKTKDPFNIEIIDKMLDAYIIYTKTITELNKKLNNKMIRKTNFPCEISENIVKFVLRKKYNI